MSTNQDPATGGPPGGELRDQPGGTAEEARQRAREMADEVEQRARAKGEEMRERVERKGEDQKERAAGTVDALADAIRAAGSTLRDRHEERLGQFTDQFADQVERFSGYLRDHDVRGLMHDVEDMARRNPTAFLGSTLAAGLVAGRFLRASGQGDKAKAAGSEAMSMEHHRPPSHVEFASNSPTPELNTPREAADSSSPTRLDSLGRATTHTAGGSTS